jgi:hypothetical protein
MVSYITCYVKAVSDAASKWRVIKSLCAPDDYVTNTKKNKQNYFKQFQLLTTIT